MFHSQVHGHADRRAAKSTGFQRQHVGVYCSAVPSPVFRSRKRDRKAAVIHGHPIPPPYKRYSFFGTKNHLFFISLSNQTIKSNQQEDKKLNAQHVNNPPINTTGRHSIDVVSLGRIATPPHDTPLVHVSSIDVVSLVASLPHPMIHPQHVSSVKHDRVYPI